jgi:glutamyl-tRNA reductase
MLYVLGVDFQKTDVTLREKAHAVFHAMHVWVHPRVAGWLYLATCNRVEWYVSLTDNTLVAHLWQQWSQLTGMPLGGYTYTHQEALSHLIHVTCGKRSMVLDETHIIGQVRHAMRMSALDATLRYACQLALGVAKRAHQNRQCHQNNISACTVRWLLSQYSLKRILCVGAGTTIQAAADVLKPFQDTIGLYVTNRTQHHAQAIIQHGFQWIAWEEAWHGTYDAILVGTSSQHYIITLEHLKCKYPIVVIDWSVPRNVHPDVALLPYVTYFDLENLLKKNIFYQESTAPSLMPFIQHAQSRFAKHNGSLKALALALDKASDVIFKQTMQNIAHTDHATAFQKALKRFKKIAIGMYSQHV